MNSHFSCHNDKIDLDIATLQNGYSPKLSSNRLPTILEIFEIPRLSDTRMRVAMKK